MNSKEARAILLKWLVESGDSRTCQLLVLQAGEQICDGHPLLDPVAKIIGQALIDTASVGNAYQFLNPPGIKRKHGRPREISQAITDYLRINELEQIERKKNPDNKKSLETAIKNFAIEVAEDKRTVKIRYDKIVESIRGAISDFTPEEGADLFRDIYTISKAELE